MGPVWSGMLLFFPVMVAILGTFTHATQGPDAVAPLLRGLMTGCFGGVTFSLCIALFLGRGLLPLGSCYALAAVLALGVSWLVAHLRALSVRHGCGRGMVHGSGLPAGR